MGGSWDGVLRDNEVTDNIDSPARTDYAGSVAFDSDVVTVPYIDASGRWASYWEINEE